MADPDDLFADVDNIARWMPLQLRDRPGAIAGTTHPPSMMIHRAPCGDVLDLTDVMHHGHARFEPRGRGRSGTSRSGRPSGPSRRKSRESA